MKVLFSSVIFISLAALTLGQQQFSNLLSMPAAAPSLPQLQSPTFPQLQMPPPPSAATAFQFPRFPMMSMPMVTLAPLPMPTFHTLPPFTPPPPIPLTPIPPSKAMAPVQWRYDHSPPRRRINYQNPNLEWREIPKDRPYQSPDRYQPINWIHPAAINQNVGYENDIGHIWYLCTTGNCGRGKK
uniref:Uncharacterized protein n=1 Tax=Panagrolaimus davidi TaxID=227884 RepID=A0A914QSP3_9BILA